MKPRIKPRKKKPIKNQHKRFPIELALLGGILLLIFAGVGSIFRAGKTPAKARQEASGTPRLEVDQEVADLGDVRLGQTVNISFTLTNAGDGPLEITQDPFVEVKEGC